jgi:hypothetical protein
MEKVAAPVLENLSRRELKKEYAGGVVRLGAGKIHTHRGDLPLPCHSSTAERLKFRS